ncbi:MAG: cheR3, partial [Myxococcaceae bacterium]|nr:cheR3 [Myxococcaceae bacterium]
MGNPLPLQLPVFSILTRLIEARSGLHYRQVHLERLATALSPRARELGLESLLDYYYFLRYDPNGGEELDRLLETLVNHETYFFREDQQLRLLVDTFLAPMV